MDAGTIPVERAWSVLAQMLPAMARSVPPRWLRLLAKLPFLRTVYSHCNAGLPFLSGLPQPKA